MLSHFNWAIDDIRAATIETMELLSMMGVPSEIEDLGYPSRDMTMLLHLKD